MHRILVIVAAVLLAVGGGLLAWREVNRIDYGQAGLQIIPATSFRLDDVEGKVIYLDFWASWCKPCRESFPWMIQMAERFHVNGLRVIAINLDQREGDMQQFLDEFNVNFTVVHNPSFSLFRQYSIVGLPTSILFDNRSGTPRQLETYRGFNRLQEEAIEERIQKVLEVDS